MVFAVLFYNRIYIRRNGISAHEADLRHFYRASGIYRRFNVESITDHIFYKLLYVFRFGSKNFHFRNFTV